MSRPLFYTAPDTESTGGIRIENIHDDDPPQMADDADVVLIQGMKAVFPTGEATSHLNHHFSNFDPDKGIEIGDAFSHEVVFLTAQNEYKAIDYSGIEIKEIPAGWTLVSNTVPGVPDTEIQQWIDTNRANWGSTWTIGSDNKRDLPYPNDTHTLSRRRMALLTANPGWMGSTVGEIVLRQEMKVVSPGESDSWFMDIKFVLPGGSAATHVAKQGLNRSTGQIYWAECPHIP